jgi:hypothetical protein
MGAELVFKIIIPYDAVATFDPIERRGNLILAEKVPLVSPASLSNEFATITSTQEICGRNN